jgi:hypothetical protein
MLKSYRDYVPQTALTAPAPVPTLTAEVAQVAEQVLVKVLPQTAIVAPGPVADAPAPKAAAPVQALNVAPTAVSHSIG